jgi:hypothetical protein
MDTTFSGWEIASVVFGREFELQFLLGNETGKSDFCSFHSVRLVSGLQG